MVCTSQCPFRLNLLPPPAALKVDGENFRDDKMTLQTPEDAVAKPKEGCCGGGCQ
jgi:hypothetical protein